MTDDDIIRMAQEACEIAPRTDWNSTAWVLTDEGIKHFAELVAKHEREACAKLVEPSDEHRLEASWAYLGGEEGVTMLDNRAKAIRARGDA
jgi:hypothetical protein